MASTSKTCYLCNTPKCSLPFDSYIEIQDKWEGSKCHPVSGLVIFRAELPSEKILQEEGPKANMKPLDSGQAGRESVLPCAHQ